VDFPAFFFCGVASRGFFAAAGLIDATAVVAFLRGVGPPAAGFAWFVLGVLAVSLCARLTFAVLTGFSSFTLADAVASFVDCTDLLAGCFAGFFIAFVAIQGSPAC
jgi:hypothetical protein